MATILLVEDTPANLALATKLLRAAGHEVLTAETAAAGIALARERLPDLVLMDLGLPDMDGWQALSEIRADRGRPPGCASSRSLPTPWSAIASGRSRPGSTTT